MEHGIRVITGSSRSDSREAENVLVSIDSLVRQCRRSLIADLREAPRSDMLVRYFEGGKLLRARLVFMAASAVGGDPRSVSLAAQAIELLHGASLVHDDIIDGSSERRGFPALHIEVGVETALALGDYLLLRAFAVLATDGSVQRLSQGSDVISIFSAYGQECCRGQISELGGSINIDSEEKYISMVRGKTGSLFAAATTIGATLAGGAAREIEALREFGLSLGVAYQIHDDMLELVVAHTPDGTTVQERPLLQLIYLAKYGTPESRAEYLALSQRRSYSGEMSALLKREGIFDLIIAAQDSHIAAALNALKRLRSSCGINALASLVHKYRCRLI